MGSEYNPRKSPYDISMSKRTRKPLNRENEANQLSWSDGGSPTQTFNGVACQDSNPVTQCTLTECISEKLESPQKIVDEKSNDQNLVSLVEEENDHKSLKQLIDARSSLGKHLTLTDEMKQPKLVHKHHEEGLEEKKLQLVVKHHEGSDGVKFKKMVRRCAKVLSRLIKNKRDPQIGSRKLPTLR